MTLEYRCSNCGTLLQTTNADPLHDEIERLRALLISCRKAMEASQRFGGQTDWQHMIAAINAAVEQKADGGKPCT